MVAVGLRWYVQVTILETVKTRPCSLFMPFWQDIIVLQPQQGEKHRARCTFRRLMSVLISTDVLLNMSLTVLLQVSLYRSLVGNTYFPLVIVCLAHTTQWVEELTGILSFLITLKKIMRQQEIFSHCSEKNSFVKWNPRLNIQIKRLLSYLISELLLTFSMLMITLMFCSSQPV